MALIVNAPVSVVLTGAAYWSGSRAPGTRARLPETGDHASRKNGSGPPAAPRVWLSCSRTRSRDSRAP